MGSGYKLPYTAAEINKKLGDTDKCLPVLIDLDTYGETPVSLILGSLFVQGGGVMENVDIGNLMDALLTDNPLRVHFTFGVNVLYAYGVCVGRVNDKCRQLALDAMFAHQGKTYLVYASIDAVDAGKANISMSVEEPGELPEAPVQSVNGQTGAVQLSASDVGALSSSELPAAINTALAQAKESGEFDGKDGSNGNDGVSATHRWNGTVLTVTSASGTSSADLKGAKGDKGDSIKGDPGADGVSPTVAVSKSGKVTTVSITDKNGTKTATINDGADGSPGSAGKDGTSVTHSWSGSTLTVTSASGTSSANLKGEKGDKGDTGPKPVKGTDYWTDADRETIKQQVLAELGAIPVYGTIDENKNITLTAFLENGTYKLRYADADGNVTHICTYEHNYVPKPSYTNLFVADTAQLNKRTNSSGSVSDNVGCFLTDYIDLGDAMASGGTNVLHYKGMYFNTDKWTSTYEIYGYICYYDSTKKFIANENQSRIADVITADGDYTKVLNATHTNARYIRISASILPNPSSSTAITALTSKDQLANVKITLNEVITE